MKYIKYPKKENWESLAKRPEKEQVSLRETVKEVFDEVKSKGDKAVLHYTSKFDKTDLTRIKVSEEEFSEAESLVSGELKSAIHQAKENIWKFHETQWEQPQKTEVTEGVVCWRESRPIEKVGLYIPGGTAPLFSTVLMLGIPAKIAGCKEIALCSPPDKEGKIHPAILFTAKLIGIKDVFKAGGIQAIAGLTFGTKTIPAVYKIFGPGNQYVTAGKQYAQEFNVAIDMPAGPSEVLVIADKNAVPAFVASDLLSQAEHGLDSQVVLVSDSQAIIEKVLIEVEKQTEVLTRKEFIRVSIQNSVSILLENIEDCIEFSNLYAPEHLIIATENPEQWISKITNAGSVFLGNYSCESAGDYASGTNHTLPTNGYAKNYSGVSLDSFIKKITFQKLTEKGIKNIGETVEIMAEAEALTAHKNAVSVRLDSFL